MSKNLNILITLVILTILVGILIVYSNKLDLKEKYSPDVNSFQLIIQEDFTYKYNWSENKFIKYNFEDTVTINHVLNKNEQIEILTVIKKYNLFNLDSIYIVGDKTVISSHSSIYKLSISDKNKNRIFDINTMLGYNKLSNKNDYNKFIKAYLEIFKILNNNKSIQYIF